MNDRNARIISRVRDKLGQIGTSKIQNEDIFDYASMVIDDMLQEMKCKQTEIKVYTKVGQEKYSLKTKSTLLIKELFKSWTGDELQYEANWKETDGLTGSYALYYHIFDNNLYLAPTPANADDVITIWAYQTSQSNAMDDDVEPETPESIDNVLVFGICAEFDSSFAEKYEYLKIKKTPLFHTKTTANRINKPTW